MKRKPLANTKRGSQKGGGGGGGAYKKCYPYKLFNKHGWDRAEAKATCQHKKRKPKRGEGGRHTKNIIITIYSTNMDGVAVKRKPLANTKRGAKKAAGGRGRAQKIGGGAQKITNYSANIDGIMVKRMPLANTKRHGPSGWGGGGGGIRNSVDTNYSPDIVRTLMGSR